MSPSPAAKPPRNPDDAPRLSPDEKEFITAAINGDIDKVRQLLAKGIQVDMRDSETFALGLVWNVTPLMCAADKGHLEVVRALLEAGADVSAVCEAHREDGGSGTQALHFAVRLPDTAVAEALLDAGADLNAIGRYGRPPLTVAISEDNVAGVKMLLKRDADVNLNPKKKGYSPPLLAAAVMRKGTKVVTEQVGDRVVKKFVTDVRDPEMFRVLLAAGADPNTADSMGRTAMISLAWERDVPIDLQISLMELLLKAGADPNQGDKDGDTPILGAACRDNAAALKLLAAAGADFNRVFKRGTALDVTEQDLKSAQAELSKLSPDSPHISGAKEHVSTRQAAVDVLKELGAKRQSELPKPEPAKVDELDPTPIGAAHFLKFIYNGEAEWSLLAVKAPLKKVADAFEKMSGAKKRERDVPFRAAAEDDEVAQLVAVIQPEDNPWTVIYRTLFHVNAGALEGVVETAKQLSRELKTKAISFASEDVSGALGYELFEKGKSVESAEWVDGAAFHTFESKRREEPELESVDHKFVDQLFRELGIYLPACHPAVKGKRPLLAVTEISWETIELADLFTI